MNVNQKGKRILCQLKYCEINYNYMKSYILIKQIRD